ncbi:MAG: phage regulatory protein/antirepressor Ant [Lentimicrobium sp.]|jgi:phage antirepressor YoqD-like protein|nr:phage regulatory protein/antirepressor Ant [Lentimicrobium sp.]
MNIEKNNAMSSREIADLTTKRHSDVMRDIRVLVHQLNNQTERKSALSDYSFNEISYLDINGISRPEYLLSKKETLLLVSGYNPVLRAKIIDRWEELEGNHQKEIAQAILNPDYVISMMELIKAERAEKQLLLSAKSKQDEVIRQQAPKVEYYNEVLNSEGLISVTQIAADLGLTAIKLNKWLFEQQLQFKVNGSWVPAAKIKDKDFMRSRTYTYTDHTGVIRSSLLYYWTERGRQYIIQLHKKLNANTVVSC